MTTETDTVFSEIDPRGVARLVLNRPERHNAFDDALILALTEELLALEQNPAVRVVVLEARGKSFSAGADLEWMRRMASYGWEENFRDSQALATLMQTLNQLDRPTLARVHGPALGGGVGLAACCDIAIASEEVYFALSEVKLGLIPAVISPYVIAAIGARAAQRYFITAERISAAEALRLGLVHEVVAGDALDTRIESLVDTLLANGPQAMREAKKLVRHVNNQAFDAALIDETARRIADRRASEEAREGLAAFLEKRRPAWQVKNAE